MKPCPVPTDLVCLLGHPVPYCKLIFLFIYLFKFIVLMQPFGYERPTPHLILTDNIHSDTQAEPRKLSSLTLYIDLWQEGKPAPGQNPPVISPPVIIFRRICVRAEIRTQNPVLSNTRLVKMVPLSHLRRPCKLIIYWGIGCAGIFFCFFLSFSGIGLKFGFF
jgi:hypothetical protein